MPAPAPGRHRAQPSSPFTPVVVAVGETVHLTRLARRVVGHGRPGRPPSTSLFLVSGAAAGVVGALAGGVAPAAADPEPSRGDPVPVLLDWARRYDGEEAARREGGDEPEAEESEAGESEASSREPAPEGGSAKEVTPRPRPQRSEPAPQKADPPEAASPKAAPPKAAPPKAAPRKAAPAPTKSRAPKPKANSSRRMSATLAVAAGLSGIPYRWGGTTTSGFDCSGFTQHVFRKVGVNLPRTAAQQQRAVRTVTEPRPGDLVFFGAPAHHVGIYAGDGRMYDAPRTGRTTGLHRIWSSRVSYGRAA